MNEKSNFCSEIKKTHINQLLTGVKINDLNYFC